MITVSDRSFRRKVESCEWDTDFTHDDHVRLAWIYLQEFGRDDESASIAAYVQNEALHRHMVTK